MTLATVPAPLRHCREGSPKAAASSPTGRQMRRRHGVWGSAARTRGFPRPGSRLSPRAAVAPGAAGTGRGSAGMKFTLSWLKEHLETEATLDDIVEALTDLGLEVESV